MFFIAFSTDEILLFTSGEIFTLALADGLSLEFERQQVSSSFMDS